MDEIEKIFLKELEIFLKNPTNNEKFDEIYSDLTMNILDKKDTPCLVRTFCALVEALDNSQTSKTASAMADYLNDFLITFNDEECLIEPIKKYIEGNTLKRSEVKMLIKNIIH